MDLEICQHMKLGGAGRCGSPAMRGQDYCYFHVGAHRAIPSVNLWPNRKEQTQGRLSDEADQNLVWPRGQLTGEALAIQLGLSRLVQGLMQKLLSVRQAKIILAALHQAAANRRDGTATEDSPVTSNQPRLPIPSGGRAAISESRGG